MIHGNVEGRDPHPAAESISALVDHHQTWHVDDLKETAQLQGKKLDLFLQFVKTRRGGRTRRRDEIRGGVVREIEQGNPPDGFAREGGKVLGIVTAEIIAKYIKK